MDNLDTFASAAKYINFPNPIYRYTQVKNQLEGMFSLIPEIFWVPNCIIGVCLFGSFCIFITKLFVSIYWYDKCKSPIYPFILILPRCTYKQSLPSLFIEPTELYSSCLTLPFRIGVKFKCWFVLFSYIFTEVSFQSDVNNILTTLMIVSFWHSEQTELFKKSSMPKHWKSQRCFVNEIFFAGNANITITRSILDTSCPSEWKVVGACWNLKDIGHRITSYFFFSNRRLVYFIDIFNKKQEKLLSFISTYKR